jgi:predicted HTH domain antitoxin
MASKRRVIETYRSGDVSMKEAARIANASLGKWFEIAREEGLTYRLSPEELEKDVENARKL